MDANPIGTVSVLTRRQASTSSTLAQSTLSCLGFLSHFPSKQAESTSSPFVLKGRSLLFLSSLHLVRTAASLIARRPTILLALHELHDHPSWLLGSSTPCPFLPAFPLTLSTQTPHQRYLCRMTNGATPILLKQTTIEMKFRRFPNLTRMSPFTLPKSLQTPSRMTFIPHLLLPRVLPRPRSIR